MAGTWGGPDSQRLNLRQQQRKLGVLEAGNLAINTRNSDRSVALLWKAVAAAADHMSKDDAPNLAPGNPRTLAFGDNVRKDLTLLELDECVLQELLDKGLTIKGEADEDAVLCSETQTFAIKTVETTNSVWLVQPDEGNDCEPSQCQPADAACTPPGQHLGLATQLQRNESAAARRAVVVTAVASSHLELVRAAPALHRLDELLQECAYGRDGEEGGGMECDGEEGGGRGGYTREQLLERVQASPAELDAALRERHTLCLGGRFRSVDPDYLGTLLEVLLLSAEEQGWDLGNPIPEDRAAEVMQASGYPPSLTRHCLEVYGSAAGEGEGSGNWWRLEEGAVCRHFARKLLGGQAEWREGEFMEAWRGALPEGMEPCLGMLRGEALLVAAGGGAGVEAGRRVRRFSAAHLPREAAARFKALFAERERWLWEDLEPYVAGLQSPGQTVEGLLLKYARANQPRPSDPITYSAR